VRVQQETVNDISGATFPNKKPLKSGFFGSASEDAKRDKPKAKGSTLAVAFVKRPAAEGVLCHGNTPWMKPQRLW